MKYRIALTLLLLSSLAYAGGQIAVMDPITKLGKVIKGGTGIDVNGATGIITATGESVSIGAQPFSNLSTSLRGRFTAVGAQRKTGWKDIRDYGAVADGKRFSNGSISAGSNVFHGPTAAFNSGHVGKMIQIKFAGTSSNTHVTTISGFRSYSTVTIASAASNPASNVTYQFGTNNSPAINSALAGGGAVYVPAGIYAFNEELVMPSNSTLFGDGGRNSELSTLKSGLSTWTQTGTANPTTSGITSLFTDGITITGLYLHGGGIGIYAQVAMHLWGVKNATVSDNYIEEWGERNDDNSRGGIGGIYLRGWCQYTHVTGNHISHVQNGINEDAYGINGAGPTDTVPVGNIVSGNIIDNFTHCILSDMGGTNGIGSHYQGMQIINNTCTDNAFPSGPRNMRSIVILGSIGSIVMGNTIKNTDMGIRVMNCESYKVSNNTMLDIHSAGIISDDSNNYGYPSGKGEITDNTIISEDAPDRLGGGSPGTYGYIFDDLRTQVDTGPGLISPATRAGIFVRDASAQITLRNNTIRNKSSNYGFRYGVYNTASTETRYPNTGLGLTGSVFVEGSNHIENMLTADYYPSNLVNTTDFLRKDGVWATPPSGAGDMVISTYDPQGKDADAFDRTNHTGTQSADTITDGTTNKAYTATEQTKLAAISGTNTGDETTATIKSKLGISTLSGSNTGDQDLSTLVPKTTTVNGHALSGNVSVTAGDVSLGNVENVALSTWAGSSFLTTLGVLPSLGLSATGTTQPLTISGDGAGAVTGTGTGALFTWANTGSSGSPTITYRRSRGNLVTPSATQSGDTLGRFQFQGYATDQWDAASSSASIDAIATENFANTPVNGATTHGGAEIRFGTKTNSAASRTEKMRLTNDGALCIGNTTCSGAGKISANAEVITPKLSGITDTGTVANLHAANSDALNGHADTYFLAASATATDSDKLDGQHGSYYAKANGSTHTQGTSTTIDLDTNDGFRISASSGTVTITASNLTDGKYFDIEVISTSGALTLNQPLFTGATFPNGNNSATVSANTRSHYSCKGYAASKAVCYVNSESKSWP